MYAKWLFWNNMEYTKKNLFVSHRNENEKKNWMDESDIEWARNRNYINMERERKKRKTVNNFNIQFIAIRWSHVLAHVYVCVPLPNGTFRFELVFWFNIHIRPEKKIWKMEVNKKKEEIYSSKKDSPWTPTQIIPFEEESTDSSISCILFITTTHKSH